MKYMYDILLNFSDVKAYEFYEWNNNDEIEYFKKVPLFRINNKNISDFVIGNIIEDKSFKESIYNVAEIYDHKMVRHVKYAGIVTDGEVALAFLLDNKGKIIMMSKMLIDEESEVLEIGNSIKEVYIDIKVNSNNNFNNIYLTRLENYKKFFLNKEIDSLYDSKNINKLKYLYFECSNKIEDDINMIYLKLKDILNDCWDHRQNNLYDLVRLSYTKR